MTAEAPDLVAALAPPTRGPERGLELLDARGRTVASRTWAEVRRGAEASAARLVGSGAVPGEPVIVSLPTSLELVETWLGALFAGALPLALAPAVGAGAGKAAVERAARVAETTGARRVVAAEALRDAARRGGFESLADLVRAPTELADTPPLDPGRSSRDPDDPAFLQLTSGSTGHPRAVVVSHRAATYVPDASDLAVGMPFGGRASARLDAVVSWLPLHHDMGLVGGLLSAMACDLDLVLMSPRTFLARPAVWLREVGGRGSTVSPAPDFAYRACLDRVDPESLEGIDLGGWLAALVGAEMIRPDTATGFAERFGAVGFRPERLRPCYGLAEATLAVTYDSRGEGVRTRPTPDGERDVVCLGEPIPATEVAVVAPDGEPRAEGEVGEVRVRGPGLFSGYWKDPEATAAAFAGDWLRTGDLGFLAEGELYLTGRTKDLIIVRGQNLMPHELEWCAEAVTGGGGAARTGAFAVDGPEGETPVVVCEVLDPSASDLAAIAREVRVRIGRELGLVLADVALVRRGALPRTTSGKVRRAELRRLYLAGRIPRVDGQGG